MPKQWEVHFPHLGNWIETSRETISYNCFAYALGDQGRRWDPTPGYYWPPDLPRSVAPEVLIEIFQRHGYSVCSNGKLQFRYEKIVLYMNRFATAVEHAARQLPDGKWTSKIGDFEDISHESPHSLSVGYGQPICYMRRRRTLGVADFLSVVFKWLKKK